GTLWFGTTEGAVRYKSVPEIGHPLPPKVYLTGIRATGSGTPNILTTDNGPSSSLPSLAYDQNSVTFEFLGLSFFDEGSVRYSTKRETFDQDWPPPSPERSSRFTNLPPGRYRFLVKACSLDRKWSEPQRFDIVISPPYWQTWWFRL